MAAIDQDFYPELLHKMVLVNGPEILRSAVRFAGRFLDKRTFAKIDVFPVAKDARAEIEGVLDLAVLPARLRQEILATDGKVAPSAPAPVAPPTAAPPTPPPRRGDDVVGRALPSTWASLVRSLASPTW